MSILNYANDGRPPILLVVWRALRHLGPTSEDRIKKLCAPESIGDAKHVGNTILRYKQLGVFVTRGEKLALASPFDRLSLDGDAQYRAFRREVRRRVLLPENNEDFLRREPSGAADFTLACAWMLSVDVYKPDLHRHSVVQNLEKDHLKNIIPGGSKQADKYVLQNDVRWNAFKAWMPFFGFAWNEPFQLDPSEAIEDELSEMLTANEWVTINRFMVNLGQTIPVLAEGDYVSRARARAEADDQWRRFDANEIPPAVTRALLGLEAIGSLELDDRADADRQVMLGSGFRPLCNVTHVRAKEVGS
ncbi:hypothetical protein ENSA5_36010 [Enhygromyxa salina]|uniref:Uncharacterized protein n=1 Tax=Enhygromyxa salina TaxID=215803 RepID=A0A2S9XUI7_9BACT|nr:protein DpdG [Enhygromyxa salina]PRP96525.1 hypothetical protein ENSA5_36010 [Enhygromyxa salina]